MALGFTRNNGSQGSIGLDLDGGYVAAVEVEGRSITRAFSADLPAGVMADGEVVDGLRLGQALREFATEHGLSRNVRLGVGNQQIAVRPLELPPMEAGAERDAAVRFLAADAIAMPLDQTVLDYQVVGERTGSDGVARTQVVVVAARESMVSGLTEAVRSAGLRPEGIDLNAFALVRMLAAAPGGGGTHVYCHLGELVNLAIAVDSTCLFTRPLAVVRDESGAPVSHALAEDIRLSIDFYMAQDAATPVESVLLSGPGASREGLAEEISSVVGLPATVVDPLETLDTSAIDPQDNQFRYTVAAGLAIGATS